MVVNAVADSADDSPRSASCFCGNGEGMRLHVHDVGSGAFCQACLIFGCSYNFIGPSRAEAIAIERTLQDALAGVDL
jgi:hypothetical protein